jgi:hypothetical protein
MKIPQSHNPRHGPHLNSVARMEVAGSKMLLRLQVALVHLDDAVELAPCSQPARDPARLARIALVPIDLVSSSLLATRQDGVTALGFTIDRSNDDIVRRLIELKADVNAADKVLRALPWAARAGPRMAISLLVLLFRYL